MKGEKNMLIKKKTVVFFLLICLGVMLFAQKDYTKLSLPSDSVVASVNGKPIYAKSLDIESNLAFTLLSIKQTNENFYEILLGTEEGYDFLVKYKTIVLYKLIDSNVLIDIAKSYGIDYDDRSLIDYVNTFIKDVLNNNQLTEREFENYIITQGYESLSDYKEHLAFQRKVTLTNVQLMDRVIVEVPVSDAEIDSYIKEHPSADDKSMTVHLSHILLQKKEDANIVLSSISSEGFEKAAARYSEDELTKNNGGDLGWLQKGAFPQFDIAFDAKPGDVLGPIQTQLGFHIIRVDDFSGGQYGQAIYRQEVKNQLMLEKKVVLWEKWLVEEFPKIKSSYTIEIYF
jgi:foldase protein PrsA